VTDALKRAIRTLIQLVAAGGLTAVVNTFADGLTASQATLVLAGWGFVVSWAQNALENRGTIPAVLKAPQA